MVSAVTLLKKSLSVNDSVIDNFNFSEDEYGVTSLHVYLHPRKSHKKYVSHHRNTCANENNSSSINKN